MTAAEPGPGTALPAPELGGSFAPGRWRVRRPGYGAMQLAGDGVFGPPPDRDEALPVLPAPVAAGVDHVDTAQFYGRARSTSGATCGSVSGGWPRR